MTVIIFTIFLNAVPGLLVGSGVAEDMGINPSIGGDDKIQAADEKVTGDPNDPDQSGIEPTGGFGETLFTLYTSLGGVVQTILGILIGAEIMLISLGLPDWLVLFFFAPKFMLIGAALIYVLAGRRF